MINTVYQIKRIYENPAPQDGARVLVDRLWPRGVSKDRAALDLWLKQAAPSPDLRVWFDHRPDRFAEFSRQYMAELSTNPAVETLVTLASKHLRLTLLYAARDPVINHAAILKQFLDENNNYTSSK